jgi:aryl-alcohol dehydrogenase-like predicted oxidoreductase
MRREGTVWIPDGRARTLLSDCEASLVALEGIPISLYLLHAPDPSRSWRTSLRALARVLDEDLVRHVGLSNVSRVQLEEAAAIVPVTAVEISLSPFDDSRLRDGTAALCAERGITVIAHSPLGGLGAPTRWSAATRWARSRNVAVRLLHRPRSRGCSTSARTSSSSPARGGLRALVRR